MKFVVNTESGKIYEVKDVVTDSDPLSPTYKKKIMQVVRLFDGFVPKVKIKADSPNYRELTDLEKSALAAISPTLAPHGKCVTIDLLNDVAAHAPSVSADDEPHDDEAGAQRDASAQDFLERALEQNMPQVGTLVEPTARDTFDRIIVADKVREELNMGLNLIIGRAQMDNDWGLSEISPMQGRCVMNFVGPPGTGKTQSAKAVAKAVSKKLYKVDYASIISKWVGDTGKHIKAAFAAAKKHDAILFFDEADSLMSKRLSMPEDGVANSINQNRNILMQELDAFDGIVLMASNFFENYDEALLRRIAQHVHFDLPNEAMREKIIDIHLPAKTKARFDKTVNLKALAKASKGLSGGDILVVCENAIKRASLEGKGKLTQAHLVDSIDAVKQNKIAHKSWKEQRRPMGLGAQLESAQAEKEQD